MKVKFNGPEAECTVYGRTFEAGKAVDTGDLGDAIEAKLANNPTFSVVAAPKPVIPAPPAAPPAAA